jgi:thiol-disulfide isomerase/thioredoxin
MVSPRKRKSFSTVVACALVLSGLATAVMAADTEPAPRFNARTMSGEKFTNDSLKGKVVLLQFWATWCQFCRSEQALVDSLDHEFGGKGLVVLAVDVNESKKTVKKYLEQSPRSCRVVLTEDTNLAAMFAANRYPIYVVIDRDGDVVGRQHGAAGERALRSLLRRAGIQSEQQTSSESGQ